jgi:DNA-binding response OmpR family regulator
VKIATLCHTRSLENFTAAALRAASFDAIHHQHLSSLLSALRADDTQAVLLEDNDEHIDGWLAALRMHGGRPLPIVVVGLGDSVGISRALQHGADDYAVIGDGTDTLVHRLRGRIQSRVDRPRVTSLRAGPYSLHAPTQILSMGAGEVSLTAREFALAWALFENLGRVVSMKTLSTEIWGRSSDIGKRTIEQHVYKLRRKFGGDAPGQEAGPRIQTVYGVGYRLQL